MQSSLTGCGHASRRRKIVSHGRHGRCRSRLAVGALVLALAGCAPDYVDYGYAVSDNVVAAPRKPPAAKRISAPSQALLTPEHKPDCEADAAVAERAKSPPTRVARREGEEAPANTSDVSDAQRPTPPSAADADLALRIKLEYERECYKQAEGRVRARLQQLQAWTAETIKASGR